MLTFNTTKYLTFIHLIHKSLQSNTSKKKIGKQLITSKRKKGKQLIHDLLLFFYFQKQIKKKNN